MPTSKVSRMPSPIDVQVGSRIHLRRVMVKMSQTDLGNAVGVTFQQVQRYEKGTNRVSASRLQRAGDVLGVPVTFFFEGAGVTASGDTSASDELSLFISTPEGLALHEAFTRITDDNVRRKLIGLVKAVSAD